MIRTLAITGLFSPFGRQMARLAAAMGVRVLGIDIKPLTRPFPGVEFVQTDIRNPLLAELFKAEQVEAVLHCAFRWRLQRSEEIFDSNVVGTMHLLGACEMAGVRKFIMPSSTVVYGAVPGNPAFLSEYAGFAGRPHAAYVHELREIETFINGYRRQRPDMILTVLRFANVLGGSMRSPLARYLALPAAPVLLGFEPRLQVLHFNDALRALGQALQEDVNGIFNVAADPPLPLYQLLALAGVPPLPVAHPLAYAIGQLRQPLGRKADALLPLPWDYLRYSWVADTGHMHNDWGFQPAHDAHSTVREWGEALRRHRTQHNRLYARAASGWQTARRTQYTCRRVRQAGWRRLRRATKAFLAPERSAEVQT